MKNKKQKSEGKKLVERVENRIEESEKVKALQMEVAQLQNVIAGQETVIEQNRETLKRLQDSHDRLKRDNFKIEDEIPPQKQFIFCVRFHVMTDAIKGHFVKQLDSSMIHRLADDRGIKFTSYSIFFKQFKP